MTTFSMVVLGCKVNTCEAESIRQALEAQGYEEVPFNEPADVALIFTCAVTNVAEAKSRKRIHQALRLNPKGILGVVGCYVQIQPQALMDDERIDILVGSVGKNRLPELIQQALTTKRRVNVVEPLGKELSFDPLNQETFESHTRAFLKIQDGCNQFCSYCIIPYARGAERSIAASTACAQAQALWANHQEIVLTGIHTGRYHDGDVDLAGLLRKLLATAPSTGRLRISSIEITEITDDLLELVQKDARLAHHLHVPVQSGCNKTLQAMHRPYTTEQFLERLAFFRKQCPNLCLSTDLIVGFPGETEEDFQATLHFLEEANFAFIHVFPYARKKGTLADTMANQVPEEVKKERVQEVLKVSQRHFFAYLSRFIHQKVQIVTEQTHQGRTFGYSSEYLPVWVEGTFEANTMLECECDSVIQNELQAHPCKEQK